MKIFRFYQSNNFGDDLEMTIVAKNKDDAAKMIRNWIAQNTSGSNNINPRSIEERFEEKIRRVNNYVEKYSHHDNIDEQREAKMTEKILCSGPKCFSINDFLENREEIIEIFYQVDLQRTYIWHFDNKEYFLEEVNTDKEGIVDSTFVYCGR